MIPAMGPEVAVAAVVVVALDDIKAELGRVDFIKMDIQGSEMRAVPGMRSLLKRNRVKLVTEFWPWGLRLAGADSTDYLQTLVDLGFRLHLIGRNGHPEPVTTADLLELYDPTKDEFSTDLFCVKDA